MCPFFIINDRRQTPDMRRAVGDVSLLGQMRPQGIDCLSVLSNQEIPSPIDYRRRLSGLALDSYKAHGRTRCHLGDRFRVGHVVFF